MDSLTQTTVNSVNSEREPAAGPHQARASVKM